MKNNSQYIEIPKLVVLNLNDDFLTKVNKTNKIQLTEQIILVGEDEEYLYFLNLIDNSLLKDDSKETVIKLESEQYIINQHVDLELIYRTKPDTLISNLKYNEKSQKFISEPINYDNQIKILRNLIKSLDEKSTNLPKLVNIIKRESKFTTQNA